MNQENDRECQVIWEGTCPNSGSKNRVRLVHGTIKGKEYFAMELTTGWDAMGQTTWRPYDRVKEGEERFTRWVIEKWGRMLLDFSVQPEEVQK